jgi:LysR family glycine cleavage system transcriptional activator
MGRRLPPLNSLRAFEAAARHQSVSAAARELCVTHGAVSRHVAKLEQYLGVPLFLREASRLRLTPAGESYAAGVTQLFDQLQELTARSVAAPDRTATLRIGAYPTFADKVLLPRLAQFRRVFPDIGFQIETSHSPIDPADLEVDVAVRLGSGDWPDLTAHFLFDEELLPVGSPELLCGRKLHDARDFEPFVLLHAQQRPDDWETWLKSAGLERVDAHSGMRFDHSGMVYQAAINGLGLAMAQTAHVREELEQHRLVPFADTPMKTRRSYFLVHLPSRASEPVIAAFTHWLADELRPR